MAPRTERLRLPSERTPANDILDRLNQVEELLRELRDRPAVAQVEFKSSWWDQIPAEAREYFRNHVGMSRDYVLDFTANMLMFRFYVNHDGVEIVLRRGDGLIYWQRKLFFGGRS